MDLMIAPIADLEAELRKLLQAMAADMQKEVTERDRKVTCAITAVHRARNRHPSELRGLPWIAD